jgi:transcriptional regulator GlxA family with amidase domain
VAKPSRIGFIGYDKVQALDIAGPMDVFDAANALAAGGGPAYELIVMSAGGKGFSAENGLLFMPHAALAGVNKLDTVIVPGGAGIRDGEVARPIVEWLRARAPRIRRVASVCTGIYALGEARLLEGRRATTHWRYAADVSRKFADVVLEPDALFIRDGSLYTSAGITAGIDLALSLVAEDLGEAAALSVARELVVYLKRSGGQMQFSEPLQFQTRSTDRFGDLASWILRNLNKELSVETLAERTNLSARQFTRRFKDAFRLPPAQYVEKLRLDEARRRLPARRQTVESVAASVGYASSEVFRRAFERRFGIAPSVYRKRFAQAGHRSGVARRLP